MATLKTNTLTGTSTAGSIAVTGEGNSTTTNLQQGLCKMWISLDGTGTVAITDSNNVSSMTDTATSTYKVTYTNNMGQSTYPVTGSVIGASATNYYSFLTSGGTALSTSSVTAQVIHYTGAEPDQDPTHILSHGDLA